MKPLGSGISYVDLGFQGRPGVIATAVLHGAGGVALVDPGPASTLATLRDALAQGGIEMDDVTTILLTHIHLDHAGACGTLVAEYPRLRVYVHERGLPHMADPSKLVASASRLYGPEHMLRLWGEVRPVPPGAMTALSGGERIAAAGRSLDVEYTPGHASHHVSYFSAEAGLAFVGDTAGVRMSPGGRVMPPTPPPDIDLEAWARSLAIIDDRGPETLFLTHFGPHVGARALLAELRERLASVAALARQSLDRDEDDEARERWFVEQVRADLRRQPGGSDGYEAAARLDLNWRGLARYWRKTTPSLASR